MHNQAESASVSLRSFWRVPVLLLQWYDCSTSKYFIEKDEFKSLIIQVTVFVFIVPIIKQVLK